MRKPTVVYTDPPWALDADGRPDIGRATIEQSVFGDDVELRLLPTVDGRYPSDGPAFLDAVAGADALAIYRCQITEDLLDAVGPQLRVVARQGVGYDNLAPDVLARRGIVGFNIPDYCVDEVAAHTLALALAVERRIVPQHAGLSGGTFDIYAGGVPRRLARCTAGIVGFGRIGRAVGARLRMFYGRLLVCDPYVSGDLIEAYGGVKTDFHGVLQASDLISLHPVLSPETAGMLDARAFARMRPNAVLVNAARGKLVDPEALYRALVDGPLGGAGIDVFSPEDPNADPWYAKAIRLPNVVVTSHRAYLSSESEISQRQRTAEGIHSVLVDNRPPAVGVLT